MNAIGLSLGIFVTLLMGAIVGQLVVHKSEAGLLPGLVAGLWAAWPFFHHGGVNRYNFLHPVPKQYSHPLKQTFARIRQIISEKTYNFGDKWHVSTADTMQHRITATLRFIEEETKMEGDARGQLHTRKERLQRLLEMDIQLKDNEDDTTVVQFDFTPKIEGLASHACDSIISGIVSAVEGALGPGAEAGKAKDKTLPAPPWWLLAITAIGVVSLAHDVLQSVYGL